MALLMTSSNNFCKIFRHVTYGYCRGGYCRGGQVVVPSLSEKFIKNNQFSQYLGTKLDMLFKITKSVEIVIILEKIGILP